MNSLLISKLSDSSLFQGFTKNQIAAMLPLLNAYEKHYRRGETIFHAGDTTSDFGLVENGSIQIIVNFYWGSRHILSYIEEGEIFAESYASIPGKELHCDMVAAEESDILFLSLNKLLSSCQENCQSHRLLIHNLLRISAMRSLALTARMTHIAPRTIRERLLSYLSEQALAHGSAEFTIPFTRQQLADYLGVDRSALSNEISKMQRDGLLNCQKNHFLLKGLPDDHD